MTDEAVLVAAGNAEPGLGEPWGVEALYHVAAPRERILKSAQNTESPFHAMPEDQLRRYGTPADEITHWIDVSSKTAEKHAILMQHLTQISRDNPMVDPESPIARSMLEQETYQRISLDRGSDGVTLAKDPLTMLRDAFPGRPEPTNAEEEGENVSSRL